MEKVIKDFSADISIEDGERAMVVTMTTSAVDRDGEVLIPQGMNAKSFEANPVVMLSHKYYELPVGKVTAIKRGPNKWSAKIVPAERPETYPVNDEWLPDTLYSLYKQGVMRSVSVGLIPKESRPATDKDLTDYGAGVRRVVSKWELLELSLCAIPCNPEAVASALGKGIHQSEASVKAFGKAAENTTTADDTVIIAPPASEVSKTETLPAEQEVAAVVDAAPIDKHVIARVEIPEDEPSRHVVKTVDPEPGESVRHVHFLIKPSHATRLEKMVVAKLNKKRGRIYQ